MADHENIYDDEELVSTNPNQRNWRGILIALLVIIAVLSLIVTSVALLTPPDEGPRIRGSRIKLSDVLRGDFTPLLFNGSWVSNEHICYQDDRGGISLLDASDPNVTSRSLMPNETFRRLSPSKFSLSPDHKYLLLAQNIKKLFRYSYLAQYTIYDLNTRETILLTPHPEKDNHPYLLLAQWTPRDHGLIMIQDYDIYYRTGPLSSFSYRVTDTAIPGILSNGLPDWLYEEEILHSAEALWMSRDSRILLYATFNDSLVEEMHTSWYGDGNKLLYPDVRSLRYPKPDTPNPVVTLYVADLADPKNIHTKVVKPPSDIENIDYYFTTASWVSPTEVCITWLNRPQNFSVISICKSPLWKCQEIQRIHVGGLGWVDTPNKPPIFSVNGSSYITTAPVKEGPLGFYKHIVWVNIFKKQVVPLTHGKLEVVRILAWDEVNNTIYFIGISSSSPSQRHLYRVSSLIPPVGDSLHSAVCLSCNITTILDMTEMSNDNAAGKAGKLKQVKYDDSDRIFNEHKYYNKTVLNTELSKKSRGKRRDEHRVLKEKVSCQYYNAYFSPTFKYFILECLGPSVPIVLLFKTELPVPRFLLILQNNTLLKEKVAKLAIPQIKTFPVQISGGYNAQVKLYLPPGLREDEITRYPLIVQAFGAPGSQLVTEIFKIDWNTYLASTKNIIVAQIDGRGSGGQGYKLIYEVYKRLGTVEVADQLEVTEYLRDSLHFVDKRRVAIWGWSYGGFVAAHALAQLNQNVFHCGISVAPIVSWKLYDSAFAERYMTSPNVTVNYQGYISADLSNKAENLKGKMFYLIHGTADDNVQFQQSMVFSRYLSNKGVLFRQQIYPDVGHSLAGVKEHLYLSMAQFFEDCFLKQLPTDSKVGLSSGGSSSY